MKTRQKVNAALAAALCASVSCRDVRADNDRDGDIIITLDESDRVPYVPTPEVQKAIDFRKKLDAYPGLYKVLVYSDVTLSRFSKTCTWAVVGTVREVEMLRAGPVSSVNCNVALSVDACVHGKLREKNIVFSILLRDWNDHKADEMDRRIPSLGAKMLVFLKGLKNGPFGRDTLCSSIRAYVFLDDKDTEKAVVSAVKGYLTTNSKGSKREKEKYYEFLCSLMQSPVKRIRDDAERDILNFYLKDTSLDLDKPLADGRVRKEVKDYLRYLLRDERPKEEVMNEP